MPRPATASRSSRPQRPSARPGRVLAVDRDEALQQRRHLLGAIVEPGSHLAGAILEGLVCSQRQSLISRIGRGFLPCRAIGHPSSRQDRAARSWLSRRRSGTLGAGLAHRRHSSDGRPGASAADAGPAGAARPRRRGCRPHRDRVDSSPARHVQALPRAGGLGRGHARVAVPRDRAPVAQLAAHARRAGPGGLGVGRHVGPQAAWASRRRFSADLSGRRDPPRGADDCGKYGGVLVQHGLRVCHHPSAAAHRARDATGHALPRAYRPRGDRHGRRAGRRGRARPPHRLPLALPGREHRPLFADADQLRGRPRSHPRCEEAEASAETGHRQLDRWGRVRAQWP